MFESGREPRLLKQWPKAVLKEIVELQRIRTLPIADRFAELAPRLLRNLDDGDIFNRMLAFIQERVRSNHAFDVDQFARMVDERGLTEYVTGEILPTRHEYASAAFSFELHIYRKIMPLGIALRVKELLDALEASHGLAHWNQHPSPSNCPPHVVLNNVKAMWSAISNNDKTIKGSTHLEGGEYAVLALSPLGFFVKEGQGAFLPTDVTFCTIIEPISGKQVKEYPVSRSIAPGEVDRFQMMVAATKSCALSVRFTFHFDDDVLESKLYKMAIGNRRDQKFHLQYTDGGEVRSRADFTEGRGQEGIESINELLRELPISSA